MVGLVGQQLGPGEQPVALDRGKPSDGMALLLGLERTRLIEGQKIRTHPLGRAALGDAIPAVLRGLAQVVWLVDYRYQNRAALQIGGGIGEVHRQPQPMCE